MKPRKFNTVRILGLDPGYAITGFGLVDRSHDGKVSICDYGVIRTPADMPFPLRLLSIANDLKTILDEYELSAVAVEELFFARNTTTALGTAQARGVVIATAASYGLPVYEFTPMQVKMAVTGYGKADKKQITQMVQTLLHLNKPPKPDDAADALAIAICQANTGHDPRSLAVSGYNYKEDLNDRIR